MRGFSLSFQLDPRRKAPLYRQIYQRVKQAIMAGQLKRDSRVPSVRALASELGVARATVENAYGLLMAEGFCKAADRPERWSARRKAYPSPRQRRSGRTPHLIPSTRCCLQYLRCLFSSAFRRWMRSHVLSGRALSQGKTVTPA